MINIVHVPLVVYVICEQISRAMEQKQQYT